MPRVRRGSGTNSGEALTPHVTRLLPRIPFDGTAIDLSLANMLNALLSITFRFMKIFVVSSLMFAFAVRSIVSVFSAVTR